MRLVALKNRDKTGKIYNFFSRAAEEALMTPVVSWNRLSTRQLLQFNLGSLDNAITKTSWLLLQATVTLTVVPVASKNGNTSVTVLGALLPYNLVQYATLHVGEFCWEPVAVVSSNIVPHLSYAVDMEGHAALFLGIISRSRELYEKNKFYRRKK
jgi:hypothetical protein